MDLEIKVTNINNKYHSRLYVNNEVYDEMACECKEDIGWISREMLRWYSKLGGVSAFAEAARDRQNKSPTPKGKVYYIKRNV